MYPLEIYIFDQETKQYDNNENIWFITQYGAGKVDIMNVDDKTKIHQISRWKLRLIEIENKKEIKLKLTLNQNGIVL